jgi:hypothetical protein
MDDPANAIARQDITDALDASMNDLAVGAVSDAAPVQTAARRRLADKVCLPPDFTDPAFSQQGARPLST